MDINSKENKNKIAIVAIGYNRKDSMARLLNSLQNAQYGHNDIPLIN
jgi:GT2 family glycosyltransferase